MNLSADQLAELLAGVARAQNAIIEAVDKANGGWRNTHLIPALNIAANMRSAEPRLLDLPSRILMRLQGRAALDYEAIKADLFRLIGPDTAPAAPFGPAQPAGAAAGQAPAEQAPVEEAPVAPPLSEEELFDFLGKP
ncbi:MAG: hypothetical protein IT514_11585 [Burkholderiales bacterium]|nr:hypothetical protein [Burkholderiales bacterium]